MYNEKIKEYMLKYQRKLRSQGLYKKSRSTPQSIEKNKNKKYAENALCCVKRLFGNCHLI